jgi:hypothetical protein
VAKRRRKYFVNVPKATKFLEDVYGLSVKEMNFYQLRIRHQEFEGIFDWYHTQGTMVVQTKMYTANIGEAGTDEDAAILINNYVIEKQ